MEKEKNNILYEISLNFKSRETLKDEKKKLYYQKYLEEIFQNKRKEFLYKQRQFLIENKEINMILAKVLFYEKNNKIDTNNKLNIKEFTDSRNKETEYHNSINNNLLNNNWSNYDSCFLEDVSKFYEDSNYFIKYISSSKIESKIGTTHIVEYSRTGMNMPKILISLGFVEKDESDYDYNYNLIYYQFMDLPIICIYINKGDNYRDLTLNGYYTEESKNIIINTITNIKERLEELFELLNDKKEIKNI